jgi:hypothetical protein
MSRRGGIVWGLCALPPGIAVGFTFAAGVNLYYDFHPHFFFGTLLALALTWFFGRLSLLAFGIGPRMALVAPPLLALVWMGAFFVLAWNSYPDRAAAARKHELVPPGMNRRGDGMEVTSAMRGSSIRRRSS